MAQFAVCSLDSCKLVVLESVPSELVAETKVLVIILLETMLFESMSVVEVVKARVVV